MSAVRFVVRFAPAALDRLAGLKSRSEVAPASVDAVLYRAIRSAVDDIIAVPEMAFAAGHALKGELRHVWRVKLGRWRLFYIASSSRSQAIVLHIGYRKQGDKNDAYAEFTRMLKRGMFDAQFEDLGVQKP